MTEPTTVAICIVLFFCVCYWCVFLAYHLGWRKGFDDCAAIDDEVRT